MTSCRPSDRRLDQCNAAEEVLGLDGFSLVHLFLPRNSDIEQTAGEQSSQTDPLTTQLLRSCNKPITSTNALIIHTYTPTETPLNLIDASTKVGALYPDNPFLF